MSLLLLEVCHPCSDQCSEWPVLCCVIDSQLSPLFRSMQWVAFVVLCCWQPVVPLVQINAVSCLCCLVLLTATCSPLFRWMPWVCVVLLTGQLFPLVQMNTVSGLCCVVLLTASCSPLFRSMQWVACVVLCCWQPVVPPCSDQCSEWPLLCCVVDSQLFPLVLINAVSGLCCVVGSHLFALAQMNAVLFWVVDSYLSSLA